ncbi:hypothetical protein SK128_027213 [Halocaridina rubra]|uniref:Integrin alpha-2 domain-containing protein n=1 Tax=Halocaridina rubra TaxID=373956 RepID=A0AAN9FWV8_HALRR
MTLKMQLDVGAISKRILFQENHKSTLDYNLRMTSTSTNKTFIVYVEDLASAKNLTVSKAQVTVNPSGHFLVNSSNASELYGVFEEPGRPGVEWKNREYETSVRLTCSSNNTCFKPTNIGVAVEQNRLSFKVGRNDIEISLNVSVENNIAFDLHLEISKTPGLEMKSAVVSSTSVVLTCREGTNCKPHNITCNICAFPEKIMPGSMMLVKLTFQQNQDLILNQTDSKPNPELTTRIRATVFNEDSNPEDDSVDVTFLPSVEIDFSVIGVSTPETISLDLSETFASQSKVKTLRDEQSSALENPSCDLQLFKSKADLILSVKAVVVGSFFQENIKNFQLASYLMGRVLKPLSWGVNGTYHLERRTVTQQKTIETPLLVIVGVTSIPAFVIPLAILVGLVLLALLALCLYKLGFFKRKRVPKQSEDNQRIIHKIDETLHVD